MIFLYLLLIIVVMLIHELISIIRIILNNLKTYDLLESINVKEDLLYLRYTDFLNVVIEVFKRKGYKVGITDKCGEEGNGLILNNIQYAEIWKHGLTQKVEVEAAMNLVKCMQSNLIYRGMLLTLGDFKQNTKTFCHKNVIDCINGEQLLEMCKEVQKRKAVLEAD